MHEAPSGPNQSLRSVLGLSLACAFIAGCGSGQSARMESNAVENARPIAHAPLSYEVPFASVAPTLDGRLDDGAWASAEWSADFRDIQGPTLPDPRFRTRMKMLWDDTYLYIAAEMEEPELWATYDVRDMIVFHEHDFEIFIDPDGDSREYYELEVNILGTIFDLYLHTAYRDGGPADHDWDSVGLKTAIALDGTPNQPGDVDRGWTLEWAIPFADLTPPRGDAVVESWRGGLPPHPFEVWRINFSRVQWQLDVVDGGYVKRPGLPEDNWTWTPQWEINMHVPQHWGYVRFLPASK
jgi:hypothetical protein